MPNHKPQVPQEVYDLYDEYAHNKLDRRGFMERLSAFAVGGLTVPALMGFVMPDYQGTIQIPEDDPRLKVETVSYDSPKGGGKISGQLAMPAAMEGKLPGIVVVHENRGLNPYIADVGRRAALAGFVAIAPDALSPLGGYPGTDDEGRTMQRTRDKEKMLQDFIAAFELLRNHPNCIGKVGVVGFCFGGWVSNMMAVRVPELGAAVPFYGSQPTAEETAKIEAPLMLQFGGLDKRVNAGWPDFETALMANQKEYSAHFYPGVNHGFHNDSTSRYDEESATLAWERTIEFFQTHLA
ncbi:MAG: dienelactone hydrolase family protein [Saprospiraceae bacterium]